MNQKRNGLFRTHLSTALILMIVAAVLLALNVELIVAADEVTPLKLHNPRLFWIAQYVIRGFSLAGSLVALWLVHAICEWCIKTEW